MSKEQFDHIEKQMKAAADNWQPAFDEKAWLRMEEMLDAEKDRKRPVFWLWFIPLALVVLTGGYLMFKNYSSKTDTDKVQNIEQNESTSGINKSKIIKAQPVESASPQNKTALSDDATPIKDVSPSTAVNIAATKKLHASQNISLTNNDDLFKNKKNKSIQKGKLKVKITNGSMTTDDASTSSAMFDQQKKENLIPASNTKNSETLEPVVAPVYVNPGFESKADTAVVIDSVNKPAFQKNETAQRDTPALVKQSDSISNKKRSSKFYFSLASGVTGSGVKFPGTNKYTGSTGFTIGYQLSKKLSLQTGFYLSNKKYVASKNDYKIQPGSYLSTVDLLSVDANCRVIEIPLSLRFDFNPSRQWNVFAVTGLSSYIMENEKYAYHYISQSTYHLGEAAYRGNQHFLSVLRIGFGLKKKLSSQFSLGLNPGVAIPLAGVGEGQIKLFSTDVLLSLKYTPSKK